MSSTRNLLCTAVAVFCAIALFFPKSVQAQIQFEQVPQIESNFVGVYWSSMAFADVDGDGDQDVLISGYIGDDDATAELYSNDGEGNFTAVGAGFTYIQKGSVAFSDIDNDGDQDVLITGTDGTTGISELYSNSGEGIFSLISGTPFAGVYDSSVAFSDVDGDGDEDVLITGESNSGYSAKLYLNDGLGNFTLLVETPFWGVHEGSVAFADVDGDGDEDVLITGAAGPGYSAKLYANDGAGNFTIIPETPFPGVNNTSIAFSDIDSDGDQDVLITGYNGTVSISNLFTNDGSGTFEIVDDTTFVDVSYGTVEFSDVDNDGDEDLLISGLTGSPSVPSIELYSNEGAGEFTLAVDTPFIGVYVSSLGFADIDGDGDEDVLITGSNGAGPTSTLYRNTSVLSCVVTASCQSFTLELDATGNAALLASDIDNGSTVTCGAPILSLSQSEFTCSDVGQNNIELTVTGENGFSQTCIASVSVLPSMACLDCEGELNGDAFTDLCGNCVLGTEDNPANCGCEGLDDLFSDFTPEVLGTILDVEYRELSNTVFIAGTFTNVNGEPRSKIAELDAETGDLTDFNTTVDGAGEAVWSIEFWNNELIFVGDFDSIAGQPRSDFAIMNYEGVLQEQVANTNGIIYDTYLTNDEIYLVGSFTTINEMGRSRFAGLNLNSGNVLDFQLDLNSTALAIDGDGDQIAMVGFFNEIGTTNGSVALLNLETDEVVAINAPPSFAYRAVQIFEDKVYVGNDNKEILEYSTVNYSLINSIYVDTKIYALHQIDNSIFIGGYQFIKLLEFDLITHSFTNMVDNLEGNVVYDFSFGNNRLFMAGEISELDTLTVQNMAAMNYLIPSQFAVHYYADSDGDGLGDGMQDIYSCVELSGYVTNSGDCDDTDASNNNTSCLDCPELDVNNGDPCEIGELEGEYVECECVLLGSLNGSVSGLIDCGEREMILAIFNNPESTELGDVYATTVDMNGDYITPAFSTGTYDILITVEGYLSQLYTNIEIVSGTNQLDISGITAGDLNGSNGVNISDFSILNNAFGSVDGDVNYNFLADFNCDGSVNIIDISILNISFGMVGDSPPSNN